MEQFGVRRGNTGFAQISVAPMASGIDVDHDRSLYDAGHTAPRISQHRRNLVYRRS